MKRWSSNNDGLRDLRRRSTVWSVGGQGTWLQSRSNQRRLPIRRTTFGVAVAERPQPVVTRTARKQRIAYHVMMGAEGGAPWPREDEVTYFVNKDSQGWVQQTVRRRVYIELKLECTRNRSRDGQKAWDDWLCVYCRGSFPSKLRLTDHRLGGCPSGPVSPTGTKLELPVYPNLKTAKQGKDLKAALQRGERSLWDVLRDNSMWLELNPELKDASHPPTGARLHVRRFMEPSIEHLRPLHVTKGGGEQSRARPPQSPMRQTAEPAAADFVDLGDDGTDDVEPTRSRPRKRSHERMEEGHRVFHSARQFKPVPRRHNPQHAQRKARPEPGPPPHPIRVTPIQSRSPSPDRLPILAPPSPVAYAAPPPPVTPVTPVESSRGDSDIAMGLRKERHAFYVRAAASARGSVKMDIPKPALRPPIQPPGLYHLIPCGLLNFDLECGDFHAFEKEVEGWKNDAAFMDRLFAAYGRFYAPSHQAKPNIGPTITQTVVAAMSLADDHATLQTEIGALCHYIQHVCNMREVMKQRKQWDDDRQAKISNAIANAMKQWDDEHYPRLLEATWGWHPFYVSFVSNPLSLHFIPSYPLHHSVVEGLNVHALLLQQSSVQRVFPVPWCVLLLRCFLKYHSMLPPLISHPHSGGTDDNVREWLRLAEDIDGSGSRAWHLAKTYLKDEGFLMFAGARSVDSQHEWVVEVEDAWSHLINPTPTWWAELRGWCNSTQIRAIQDMAFHDKQAWLNAWVIRDRPTTPSPELACYERWLRHREDLDIGYILAKPDVMVPSLERSEYMEELRNIADNIVREHLEHSEVHPVAHSGPPTNASSCEVAQSHPQTPTNIGTSGKAAGSEDVLPFLETHSADVGPAFLIPMTQAKSLEDLPSQLDFDWQDSVSPNPTPALGAARNLGGQLDGVGTPRSGAVAIDVSVDTFVEVSQIAHEAVRDAMPQPPAEVPTPLVATTDVIYADASSI